jgi:hypothetical protein
MMSSEAQVASNTGRKVSSLRQLRPNIDRLAL